jgi:adenylate cyclase
VRIVEGAADLGPPSERERKVLERIGAPPGVRLACSIAPQRDLTVELLVVPSEARESLSARRDDSRWGVERRITVLFADLRGFTTLSERHLAYDVVFLLNRYLALMREAVENNGGQVDKFLGDGVLALFGTSGEADAGSTAALRAASGMFAAIKILNDEFSALVGQQLLMGVGIHTGSVILGKVGSTGSASGMTALGDTVNTASRLQDATKVLNCSLCVSEVAVMAAGLQFDPSLRRDVSVRGKAQTVAAYALDGSQPLPTADASAPTAAQT